jgi:hypothetical protein
MKKFLMKSATVLLFSGILTSCTHDLESNDSYSSQDALKTYEQAFISTFNRPVVGVDWGFGNNEPVVASSRALTRAIQPSFNFPSDADSKKFLKNVPQGVETLTQNVAQANNWIDESWTGEINIWGQWDGSKNIGGTLYIKGDCDFSNRKFYFAGNSELYLLEGATLTLNAENAGNLQTGCNIYIAKNAKIVTPAELKLNNGLHIYNHGTIEANKLSTNSNSWLVNSGTVNVTTKISVENELSVIENNGTIKAADINTAGSGKFENNGNVTISGTTFINSNNNTWVNNGKYKTGNFIYEAASDEVINNCMLTVDEDFNMNLGDNPGNGNFKMDAGAGVETKYFNGGGNWAKNYSTGWNYHNGGPFYIYMGENSVFKVTETATMNATKADYGIYGPSDGGFAVFQAKKIEAGKDGQGYEVTYGNNLYVAAGSHFAQGYSGTYPYIDIKGNAKIFAPGFNDGLPTITIEKTNCNPGFTGSSGSTPQSDATKVRVIAEDLSTNIDYNGNELADFDYNDVVFDVEKSGSKVKITLKAAGGTIELTVGGAEGETELDLDGNPVLKYEVHRMYKVSTGTMVNTNAPGGVTRDDVVFYIDNESGSDNIYDIANWVPIRVRMKKDDPWISLPVATAVVTDQPLTACKIGVDKTYNWCDERQSISSKYIYKDKNNVNRDPRFKLYLNGQLTGKWWLETNRLAGD